MRKFLEEFKAFAMQGNVMDMAVGIIIGGAFTAIVNSLVNDILNPLLGLFAAEDFSGLTLDFGNVHFAYGNFIMSVINFLMIAMVLFCLVRALNNLAKMTKKPEVPADPTTKYCPYCKSEIDIDAARCPNCTTILNEDVMKQIAELEVSQQ